MAPGRQRTVSPESFEALVKRALKELPPRYGKLLDEVSVVVEAEPSASLLKELDLESEDDLLGLYQGLSLADQSFFQPGGQHPPRITLYRGPIVRLCRSEEEMKQEICDTVVHELGHHVGLDDDEMPY